jgi:hypothetical protein
LKPATYMQSVLRRLLLMPNNQLKSHKLFSTQRLQSLSLRERDGVRGYGFPIDPNPLTPTLSPMGASDSYLTKDFFVISIN